MKHSFLKAAAFVLSCGAFAACGNSGGSSTPIDSVNQSGKADAQYSEGTPETRTDPTIQARDAYTKDTLGNRARTTQPSGNGTNSSNTSDARTTSGSANNGDADKDRKK